MQNNIYIPYAKKIDVSHDAHPFRNEIKGSIPSAFTVFLAEQRPTVYPRNIQEIIRNSEKNIQPSKTEVPQNYNPESSITDYQTNTPSEVRKRHDPFYSFKPQDISQVNLLAVTSVRFAPPIWIDLDNDKRKRHILKRSLSKGDNYVIPNGNVYKYRKLVSS